jgi:hypothetical protein
MEDDQKKNEKNEDNIKKDLFSIPVKFRANFSWDWLSSLRFIVLINHKQINGKNILLVYFMFQSIKEIFWFGGTPFPPVWKKKQTVPVCI